MIYKEWLTQWLDNYVKPTCKSRTFARYEQIVTKHVAEELGDYDVDAISPLILQRFVAKLLSGGNIKTNGGLSAGTVNSIITVIQNSLRTAYTLNYTQDYVADKIMRPKIVEKQVSCFNLQEQRQIEEAVLNGRKKKLYGIVLCLYTGVRIGELLALKWSDVDFAKCTLTVNKTCYDRRIEGVTQKIIETPKTNTSNRIIPLPKQLLPLLKELKKAVKSEYVIADGDKIISVRSYQRSFELLLKKLKIEHKGFHALRHTFATRALECGMDVKTLSEILGHKNANITLNRYVHSLFEHKQDMMNRLGKNLKK